MTAEVHNQNCHELYKPPDYNLEGILGAGSFSEVHKATHIVTGVAIALKMFREKMQTVSQYRSAAKEVAFLEILKHPNILQLKMYEINRTYVYIGTEFAPYNSLAHYLRNRKPTPEGIIKFIMRQLISALCYLHEMGIFHGDIKPENILCTDITENGPIIKIGDFGLSEIRLKGGGNEIFLSGSFMYMAPEVHLRYPVDCTCDLWSAGIIMYIMMFNRSIFNLTEGNKEKTILYFKRRVSPNWLGGMAYSPECNDLVKNLLTYDKHNRLTGQALRSHLFLTIPDTVLPSAETFLRNAHDSINSAINYYEDKKYGESLVEGTKAVINLKIHYNLTKTLLGKDKNKPNWEKYEEFNTEIEKLLVEPEHIKYNGPDVCSESELRKHLQSTPKMLDGFDIGCNAEMFFKEGKRDKALPLFHQALQLLLPLMKLEPKSNRKSLLGKKLKKWIEYVECLEPKPGPSSGGTSSTRALTAGVNPDKKD